MTGLLSYFYIPEFMVTINISRREQGEEVWEIDVSSTVALSCCTTVADRRKIGSWPCISWACAAQRFILISGQ